MRGLLLAMIIGLLAACAAPAVPATPQPEPTVGVIVNEPEAAPGYILFASWRDDHYYLIDREGRRVQQWAAPPGDARLAQLLENGNLLTSGYENRGRSGVREIDPAGQVVWQYHLPKWHHDFLLMPNGNVLLLGRQRKSNGELRDLGVNGDYLGNLDLMGTYLVKVRPTPPEGGEVVWEWSAWDHIIQDDDPEKPNYGVVGDHPELIDLNFPLNAVQDRAELGNVWLHTNSLAYHPEREQIMLSVRHFGELWVIDHSTTTEEAAGHSGGKGGKGGDLLYRWGNPRAWQAGGYADQKLFGLHNAHWIPPGRPGAGNVLVFNNGWDFFGLERGYSSVDEMILPAEGYDYRRSPGAAYGPAKLEWTYSNPTDFYSPVAGNAQRLSNGNTLFTEHISGTIYEVTIQGDTVWKYINPLLKDGTVRQGERLKSDDPAEGSGNWVYRAYHYPPDYPGLAKLDLTPGEPLELPALP